MGRAGCGSGHRAGMTPNERTGFEMTQGHKAMEWPDDFKAAMRAKWNWGGDWEMCAASLKGLVGRRWIHSLVCKQESKLRRGKASLWFIRAMRTASSTAMQNCAKGRPHHCRRCAFGWRSVRFLRPPFASAINFHATSKVKAYFLRSRIREQADDTTLPGLGSIQKLWLRRHLAASCMSVRAADMPADCSTFRTASIRSVSAA